MIKLVALDMDGTLLNERQELGPAVAETIRQVRARGVRVVLATGRPLPGVMNFLPELNLVSDDDYAIPYNGALVQKTASQKVLIEHSLSYADYLRLYAQAAKFGLTMIAEDQSAMYTDAPLLTHRELFEAVDTNMAVKFAGPQQIARDIEFSKIMFFADKPLLDKAMPQLDPKLQTDFYANRSEDFLLEFVSKHASKGNALRELATKLGLQADEVMAMGDSHNDVSMFDFAGTGIAMGNAKDELKAIATGVTASNKDDGVAVALRQYVLDAQQ
jgi:Cof subfamily protein (haloacid dehalogenase superfamily)